MCRGGDTYIRLTKGQVQAAAATAASGASSTPSHRLDNKTSREVVVSGRALHTGRSHSGDEETTILRAERERLASEVRSLDRKLERLEGALESRSNRSERAPGTYRGSARQGPSTEIR